MPRPALRTTLAVAALALGLCNSAHAQFPPNEDAELSPGLGQFSGRSVALGDDLAFLSAPGGLFVGQDRYVHVYRLVNDAWELEQTLDDPTPADTRFGSSLDFDGTTLVVGAPRLPSGTQSRAFTYTYDGAEWVGQELPYPPVSETNTAFGTSVAVSGDSILVGAPLTDIGVFPPGATDRGAAYAYRRTTAGDWLLKQELKPALPEPQHGFGISVDLDGFDALVGSNAERAHAFRFAFGTLWTETQVLTPSLASVDASFSERLALSGDRAILGAWQDDLLPDRGAAFVFERVCGVWEEVQRLEAPSGALTYGRTIAIDGDALIVGASSEVIGNKLAAGAAYAYRWNGASWILERRMTANSPEENEQLGNDIDLLGDRALVGGLSASPGPDGSGFLFEAAPVTSPWTDLGSALMASSTAELRGSGTLVGGTPLTLSTDCALAGSSGVLFAGFDEIDVPFKGGLLVPTPTFQITLGFDVEGSLALSTSWPVGIPPGTTLTLQAWFLDPAGPVGLGASNALRATAGG